MNKKPWQEEFRREPRNHAGILLILIATVLFWAVVAIVLVYMWPWELNYP